jgi:sterol O-acyltransferase
LPNIDQQISVEFSHFNQYFYFLFAPTLLYRDNYPRSSVIEWNNVWKMFGQFIFCLLLVYHVIANFWMPIFARFFTIDEITVEFTFSTIFDLMLPGVLIVILGKIFN